MTAPTHELVAALGDGFASRTVTVADGIALHYVCGGDGPPLVLVHGFPQDWYEWHRLLPRLAANYTVYTVDLRGVGGSDAPAAGYDAETLGTDLASVIETVGIAPAHVVGHDIGGWVGYALTRLRPDLVRSLVVLETLLPGIELPGVPGFDVPLWHIGFHQVPGLAEDLVDGRQATYFRHFLTTGTATPDVIGDDEIEHYAHAYGDRAHLRSAFEVYRALPANIEFNSSATSTVEVPLLLVGGEQCFGPLMPVMAEQLLAAHGWTSVDTAQVAGGRHYLPEECPDQVAELIERHTRERP